MKKHFYSFLAMLTAMFALSSCEDVPMPYDLPIFGGGGSSEGIAPAGTGSLDDPFNVEGVIAFIEAGEGLDEKVYIKGYVTSVKECSPSFGNATFYIASEAGGTNTFYVYRCNGLGGDKITSEDQIKEGDEVVVYGKVTDYNGTKETVQKEAFIYSINGEGGNTPPDVTPGTPEGNGTLDSPFNVAAAVAKCKEVGETATSDFYYVKGIVKTVDDSGVSQYGNITLDLVDVAGSNEVFKAFQIYDLGNKKFTAQGTVKEGDEVIVKGKLVNYKNNTPETTGKGEAYLYSLNGKTDGGTTPDVTPGTPSGNGTIDTPFNVAAAIAKCATYVDAPTTESYYVVGIVSKLSDKYANTFFISDDGTTNNELEFYNGVGIDGATLAKGDVNVGDKVVVYGQLQNYYGNTPELTKGCKIISIEKGSGNNPGGNDNPGNTGGGQIDPSIGYVMTSADILSALPNITTNAYGSQLAADESTWMSWSCKNYGWKGARICKATDTNLGVQVQGNASDASKQGFIFNTTAFSNISKVVLVVSTTASSQYEPDFSLYAGTSAHPITTKIQGAKSVEAGSSYKVFTYTYDLSSSNYGYISIWNNLAGALYINTIQVITK